MAQGTFHVYLCDAHNIQILFHKRKQDLCNINNVQKTLLEHLKSDLLCFFGEERRRKDSMKKYPLLNVFKSFATYKRYF